VDLKESIYLMQLFLLQVYFLQPLYLSVSIGTLQVNSGIVVYLKYWFSKFEGLIFLKRWYFGRCIGKSQLCKFVSIPEAVVIGTLNIFWVCFSAIMFTWIW
jgi:hypothetical protein